MANHPARCPACKTNVEALLRELYGGVTSGWSSGWPCRVEDVGSLKAGPGLRAIHASLVAHRGHAGFVRAKRLPGCDYFVPGKHGFLVEYDEAQHFTAPRAIALDGLPSGHPTAFDIKRWADLCRTTNARDNDPVYRDEQRAWYDVLRDVLPEEHGLGPTSRLLDRQIAYCSLSPKNATDIATFEKLLNRPPSTHTGA